VLHVELFDPLSGERRAPVVEEGARLLAFVAPADRHEVRIQDSS
jgi:hypothetical protein